MTEGRVGDDLERELERHRRELTAYCYRMLGSPHETEDAVQETMVRAWRGHATFEGRSGLRSWLYRIATNVCLDALRGRQRRALPMDLGPPASSDARLGAPLPGSTWIRPIPDDLVTPAVGDPAELAVSRDSMRLAFVAALHHLLPRQRAALILRDVLRWTCAEVADLLDISLSATDSLLRWARSRMAAAKVDPPVPPDGDMQQELLARYVDAFARADIDALVAIVHEDATLLMPPFALWLRGRDTMRRWLLAGNGTCSGHVVAVPVTANGSAVCAVYVPVGLNGRNEPFALHVLDLAHDRIRTIHAYIDPSLFPQFGLPTVLVA